MELNYFIISWTVINFALLVAIAIVGYKGIQGIKKFINRNKEMNKKIDVIFNKLEGNE
ncbi:hypothetical protein [Clostridium gasigenes]|uniref:hypothetical protein n=1 Tax=Clostridium gasigenes TaxID=94869 RepID=UPI001C0D2FC7|nr:hypothetical protein [Clostridium gasigenes]MBU3104561.1 hypothetical protein [Clostridium gasigenes]